MERILVLRGGALGDLVVTLPALGLLRRHWPQARIELAGNARAAQLAVGRFYLDAVHEQSDARWARLGSGTLRTEEPLGAHLRTFDLVINFWPDPDGAIGRDLQTLGFQRINELNTRAPRASAAALGASEVARPTRSFLTGAAHPATGPAAAHYCATLAPLELATDNFAAGLHLRAEDHAAALALVPVGSEPLIAWHPGSGSAHKNWPRERWLEVLQRLPAHRLVVLLGPAEREDPLLASFLPRGAIIARELSTPVLAAVLQRCRWFLGHDSGPAHVAAAAGCPCVLVFGPTDPAIWAPPYPGVRVLQRGGATAAITPDEVLEACRLDEPGLAFSLSA